MLNSSYSSRLLPPCERCCIRTVRSSDGFARRQGLIRLRRAEWMCQCCQACLALPYWAAQIRLSREGCRETCMEMREREG
eukprot:9215206-Pyramimonas_sp.AAC.1